MLREGKEKFVKTAFLKRAVFFFFVNICVVSFCFSAYPQSSLEYATLLTKQAAGSVNKEKAKESGGIQAGSDMATQAMKKVYADSAAVISRGGGMLDQVGAPSQQVESSDTKAVQRSYANSKEIIAQEDGQDEGQDTGDSVSEIHLKSGQVVKGSHFKQGDKSAEINCQGAVLTYFNDEIDKVVVFE